MDILRTERDAVAADHARCGERMAGLESDLGDAKAEIARLSRALDEGAAAADRATSDASELGCADVDPFCFLIVECGIGKV